MPETIVSVEVATRERLLSVAAELFADHGFNNVTVRQICQEAGTNVAAVNYHFRDKLGLYKEVVQMAADEMNRRKTDVLNAVEPQPPEERLRTYIRLTMHHLLDPHEQSWMEKLIARETIDPTPAIDLIIEKGIKPTAERNGQMVAELLGAPLGDPRVWKCFLSVQGQCLFYKMSMPVSMRMAPPGFQYTPEVIDALAEHVFQFSLAGIRAVAATPSEQLIEWQR
jgi:TetR/AcrR family transcriptional regulator, regulator of cefoperazone and chloramphenicol sensitivity